MRIQSVFEAALALPEDARLDYVRDKCRDNAGLFAEVESLLAAFTEGADELEVSPIPEAVVALREPEPS